MDNTNIDFSIRDHSLRTRLFGTFLILLLLTVIASGGTALLFGKHQHQDVAVVDTAGRQRMLIQKMVALSTMIARGRQEKRDELRTAVAQYQQALRAFRAGAQGRGILPAPVSVQPQLRTLQSDWAAFRLRIRTVLRASPSSMAFREAVAYVQHQSESLLHETDQVVQLYEAAHQRGDRRLLWFLVGTTGLFVILVGLSLFFVNRHVIRPLVQLTEETNIVAGGALDRNIPILDTDDEIGELTRSVRKMKARLVDALEETEIFRTAVEHAGHSIYWTDADSQIEYVNPAFEEITGYDWGKAVGASPRLLQSGEHDEAFYEELWETIMAGEVWNGELIDQRPDGERYVVSQTIAPIQNGDAQIEKFVAVGNDVTEQRQKEQQLRQQNDRLDRFSKVLSHDLRNPLNVAKGRLQLLQETRDTDLDPEGHLAAVDRALDRIDEIIADTLTLTWSEQQLDLDDLEVVSLSDAAREAWEQVDTAEASVRIEDDRSLRAHRGRLQRLLENLFRNAVEHGGESVTLRVGALADGFFVEDDGVGLSRADKIFEAGYSSQEEGTGLGLSIVRSIADAHGWQVSAGQGAGGGARFEFRTDEAGRHS